MFGTNAANGFNKFGIANFLPKYAPANNGRENNHKKEKPFSFARAFVLSKKERHSTPALEVIKRFAANYADQLQAVVHLKKIELADPYYPERIIIDEMVA